MLNISEETFDRIFQVNVKCRYLSAVHCVPEFRRQHAGCFINIGSTTTVCDVERMHAHAITARVRVDRYPA
jgi:short-subunit dehydrogenase